MATMALRLRDIKIAKAGKQVFCKETTKKKKRKSKEVRTTGQGDKVKEKHPMIITEQDHLAIMVFDLYT